LATLWKYRAQYAAISPFFVLFAVFGLYPLMYSILLSFNEWPGNGPWKWVGIANYAELPNNDQFTAALFNSLVYFAFGMPCLVVSSLVMAVILNNRRLRYRGAYRTAMFLPYVTSEIIISIVFLAAFDNRFGLINGVFKWIGIPAVPWLVSTIWSKAPVLTLFIWSRVGYYLILMIAGLQSISAEIYEAASIDGASPTQSFFSITVPLMRGMILFVMVTTTIAVLNLFGPPFILTGGGPQDSSLSLTLLLYRTAFQWVNYGLASAVAVVIAAITTAIALVQIRFLKSGE
jgi:ABC-type sugar transport system permease subunit